ncbi:hypothetical protein LCGC14_2337500 [marine sediment metagenome]|uniref:LamG-like jellyroll fold domain-containing protein n=1 Tax=marine sediment metagenome TaxID=412755 RepID=A0A0F9CDY3_9ZZZZ
MKSTGIVFKQREFFGSDPGTIYEDVSRYKNVCTPTNLDYTQLPSGLWVPTFDGSAYVTIADDPAFNWTTTLSIGAWIKKDDLVGTEAIVSKWNSSESRREWNLQIVTQKLQVAFGNPNTGAFEGTWSSDDNVIASTGIWYHVAATYDGVLAAAERVKLYVDGTAVAGSLASGVIPATLYNGTANVLIGARTAVSIQDFFSGSIDNTVIYDCIADVPATFMAALYNSQAGLYGKALI